MYLNIGYEVKILKYDLGLRFPHFLLYIRRNHIGSLRFHFSTQLYMAGVDEQEIMQRTGHRSEKSVQKYKVASSEIQKRVAAVLDPPKEDLVPYET